MVIKYLVIGRAAASGKPLFAAHGKVASANVVRDRESGRSKGFGFVEFENEEEGKAAEKALNGSELGGRTISVAEARPKEDRGFSGGGRGKSGGRGKAQSNRW